MARKVVKFESKRLARRNSHERAPDIASRVLGGLLGLTLLLFAVGLIYLMAASEQGFVLSLVLFYGFFLFLTLFAANLVWQCLTGGKRTEGFFYDWLARAERLGPAVLTLGLPAVLVASVLLANLLPPREGDPLAEGMLVAWLALLLHILGHELGHLIAARNTGLTPFLLMVGPFQVEQGATGWTWSVSRSWLSVAGGFLAVREPEASMSGRQLLWLALGGPLASLVLLAGFVVPNPHPPHELARVFGSLSLTFFSCGIWWGISTLAINLLPWQYGDLLSDGYRIRLWWAGRRPG